MNVIQLRFANQKPHTTLEIYGIKSKSLKEFARDNKRHGFPHLPDIEFRLREKEIKGTEDDYEKKKEEQKKLVEKV